MCVIDNERITCHMCMHVCVCVYNIYIYVCVCTSGESRENRIGSFISTYGVCMCARVSMCSVRVFEVNCVSVRTRKRMPIMI